MKHRRLKPDLKWTFYPIILYICVSSVMAQEDDGMLHECKGVQLDMVEEHAMSFGTCLRKYNASSIKDISPGVIACVGKCVLATTGLIDAEGHPHKENIFKFITDVLPPEVHDDLQMKFEKCLDEETEDLDPQEESCVSYLPLMMCFHLAFLEECT